MKDTKSRQPDNNAPRPHLVIPGHDDFIKALAYLPSGRQFVTGSGDGTVKVWNSKKGEQEGTSMEHTGKNAVRSLAVTRDGRKIISSDEDGRIKVWDTKSHKIVKEWIHPEICPVVTISPDDRLVAVGYRTVFIDSMEGSWVNYAIEVGSKVWSMSFSPSGDKLACGTHGDIRIYDVESGTLVPSPPEGHCHEEWVNGVLWSRDGSKLFSASDDKTIRCWNTSTGEPIGDPWRGHTDWISSLSLSPDGLTLASASKDRTVRFWDATSGHPLGRHLQHEDDVTTISFTPSGKSVASAGSDGKIYLWEVPSLDRVSPISSPDASDSESSRPSIISYKVDEAILPDLSLGTDESQRLFELGLRELVDLATSQGLQVSRDLIPSSLPVDESNGPPTGTKRIANGDSNSIHSSRVEPSASVVHSAPIADPQEISTFNKIKRQLVEMLRASGISFKGARGPPRKISAEEADGVASRQSDKQPSPNSAEGSSQNQPPPNPTMGGQGPSNQSGGGPMSMAQPMPSGTSSSVSASSPVPPAVVNGTPATDPVTQPTMSLPEVPATFLTNDFMQSVAATLDEEDTGIDFERDFREWFETDVLDEVNGVREEEEKKGDKGE
ncbi:WD40 repeat-like protein [Imleria badia]|nr:WD40 repeat-like protein [Imleria badia]